MSPRSILSFAVAAAGLLVFAASPTIAGGAIFHGGGLRIAGGIGGHCHGGGGGHVIKILNFNKNINVNNNINLNKNININKNIVIAKSNSFSIAVAGASAGVTGYASSGSYAESVTINRGGDAGVAVSAEETCEMQEGSVVKAIHAVCVSPEGREFPASHMLPETWIDTTYEGEVARCIPGATVRVKIGDVAESDQGLTSTYDRSEVLACGPGEALWHYKNGMVKCAPALPVKDCTERTNLRKYGTGDFFFSFRSKVCVNRMASSRSAELSSTTFDGGVGDNGY